MQLALHELRCGALGRQFNSWSEARNHAAKQQFMTQRVNSSMPVKQKFAEQFAASLRLRCTHNA
ncbi:MAG: hypothetical protein IJA48_08710, partial [Oscillospiraceae bacterium]|nr:hypothetical protein [Oscillospiraceae bacterium]